LVFPCHTSMISQELLLDKLEEYGDVDVSAMKKQLKNQNKKTTSKKVVTRGSILESKKKLRDMTLDKEFDTGLPDGQEPLKRVSIEALDFDWLFVNDNCKTMLEILANDANSMVLTRHSIKIFVELMWEYY